MKLPRDLSGSEINRLSVLVLEAAGFDLVVGMKSEIVREAGKGRTDPVGNRGFAGNETAVGELGTRPNGDERKLELALEIQPITTMTLAWIAPELCMDIAGYWKFLFHSVKESAKPI